MNAEAVIESWQTRDSSEWKLNSTIFREIFSGKGTPEKDPFASKVSHQLPQYMSSKIDFFSQGKNAFHISWAHKFTQAFTFFALIERVLQLVNQDHCLMLIITPASPGQPWFLGLLKMSAKKTLLLPAFKDLVEDPAGNLNPLIMQN